jgi:hypothetical protein
MSPYPPAPVAPPPGGALIGLGVAGAALQVLACGAGFIAPGAPMARLHTLAEVFLVLGAFGLLSRRGGGAWLLAALALALDVIAGLATLALSSPLLGGVLGRGLLVDLFGLVDVGAFAALGAVLLVRRADGHPGVGLAAGIAVLVRACVSLLGAVPGVVELLAATPLGYGAAWRIVAGAAGVLLAIFFATALGRRPGRA